MGTMKTGAPHVQQLPLHLVIANARQLLLLQADLCPCPTVIGQGLERKETKSGVLMPCSICHNCVAGKTTRVCHTPQGINKPALLSLCSSLP